MKPFLAAFRVLARYWLRHRVQAVLCLSGIVLGVGVYTAIEAANRGALDAFAEGSEAFAGRATHRVYAPSGTGVPDRVYADLVRTRGVEAAAPLLRDRLALGGADAAEPMPLTVLGIDPLAEAAFRTFSFLAAPGAEDADAADTGRLERFLADPDAIALPVALARSQGWKVGDTVHGRTPTGRHAFRITAVFQPPEGRTAVFARTAILDVAAHQERFDKLGHLDSVRLRLSPGAEEAVRTTLPPGLALEPAGSGTERVVQMSRAFRLNLEVMGLFALLVALFLIFNAAAFGVAQREATLGMLRCIGATGRTVFAALLAEALLIGAVGSVAGVLLGQWLGALMLRNVGATLFDVLLRVDAVAGQVAVDARGWAVGLALGVGASALGAAAPALRGARVSPLTVVRGGRATGRGRNPPARWIAAGALGLAAAALLLALPGQSLGAALGAATALALGMALLCPPVAAGVSWLGAAPLGYLLGTPGRMAARNLGRSLSRTGVAAAALMTALALALAIEITVRSFQQTLELWLDQAVTADLYLEPPQNQFLRPEQLAALRDLPGAVDVVALHSRRVVLGPPSAPQADNPAGREVVVLGLDLAAYGRHGAMPVVRGTGDDVVQGLASGAAVISETLASYLRQTAGDTLRLPTPAGLLDVPVAAVVRNYSAPQGVIYLSPQRFAELYGPIPPEGAGVWLRPGTDPEAALQVLERDPRLADVRFIPNGAIRENALRIFQRTFAITDLLGALAAFVAFMAVVSALTALLEERMPTLGYLRAIGMSRRVLGTSLALEAVLLAGVAAVVSWATGWLMSAVLVFAINPRAFGWSLQFLPGEGSYGSLLLLAVVAALLGSAYPVYRATRLSVAATIREE